jgi:hypothetical protein
MASRLRIELNQERSIGEILTAAAELYRAFPVLFAILALAVMGPYELVVLAITGYGPLRHGHESVGASLLLTLLRSSLITPLISALHMHAVVAIGEGKRPRLGTVARRGLAVLPVVAAAEIMANIGEFLGFIALVVPGVLLSIRWAVVAQAAALEGDGWLASLRSSARLTDSRYGHVFTLLLLVAVGGVAVHIGGSAIPLGSTSGSASASLGIAVDTGVTSLSALTLALLYFDLRYRATEAPRQAPREYPHLRDLD